MGYAIMIMGFLTGTFFMVYSALEGALAESVIWLVMTMIFILTQILPLPKKDTNDDTIPLCSVCEQEVECHNCIEIRQGDDDAE